MLEGFQSGVWTAMPGIVQAVDFTTMTCEVQPAIKGAVQDKDGNVTSVKYPKLVDVPIVFPSAGGFMVTLPLKVNDEVLVCFAARCIDSWWQSGGYNNVPAEARMHDLSDGFAIPGPRSQPKLPSGAISSTGAQVRNDAGTTYVEISGDGKIKLVSPSEIDVTAPKISLTAASEVDVNAPVVNIAGAATTITGNLVVTGTITSGIVTAAGLVVSGAGTIVSSGGGGLSLTGALTVTGAITGTTVTAGGIGLSTHKHTGVQTGSGTSGGPTP